MTVRGEDVRLQCASYSKHFSLGIRRLSYGKQLVRCLGGKLFLEYSLIQVTCQDTGTYECVVDYKWTKALHIEIYDCKFLYFL